MDKLSKRLLKLLNHEKEASSKIYDFDQSLEDMASTLSVDCETLRAAVRYLEENQYIKFLKSKSGYDMAFQLDHQGLHWKEFRRQEILNYLSEKWIDFLAMALALTSLVISIVR